MNTVVSVLFGLLVVVAVQAKYEFTEHAKDCITEMGLDKDTIRTKVMTDTGKVREDDESVKKLLGCTFRTHITDTNELIVDDKLITYITKIFITRTDGRSKLSELLAKECIKHCEDKKGDTKDTTAVEVYNCLIELLHDYIKQD